MALPRRSWRLPHAPAPPWPGPRLARLNKSGSSRLRGACRVQCAASRKKIDHLIMEPRSAPPPRAPFSGLHGAAAAGWPATNRVPPISGPAGQFRHGLWIAAGQVRHSDSETYGSVSRYSSRTGDEHLTVVGDESQLAAGRALLPAHCPRAGCSQPDVTGSAGETPAGQGVGIEGEMGKACSSRESRSRASPKGVSVSSICGILSASRASTLRPGSAAAARRTLPASFGGHSVRRGRFAGSGCPRPAWTVGNPPSRPLAPPKRPPSLVMATDRRQLLEHAGIDVFGDEADRAVGHAGIHAVRLAAAEAVGPVDIGRLGQGANCRGRRRRPRAAIL